MLASIYLLLTLKGKTKFLGIYIPICAGLVSSTLKGHYYQGLDFAFFCGSLMVICIAATISRNIKIRFFGIAIPFCAWMAIGGKDSLFSKNVYMSYNVQKEMLFLTILMLISTNCAFLSRVFFKKDIYGTTAKKKGIILSIISLIILLTILSISNLDIFDRRSLSGKVYTILYFINSLGVFMFLCESYVSSMIDWLRNEDRRDFK